MWELPWRRRRRERDAIERAAAEQQRAEYRAAVERLRRANRPAWDAPTYTDGPPLMTLGQRTTYQLNAGRHRRST